MKPPPASVEAQWRDLEQHLAWSEGPWLVFLFSASTSWVRMFEERTRDALAKRHALERVLRPRTPQHLRELPGRLLQPHPAHVTWVEALHLDPDAGDGPPGPWTEAWDWFMLRSNERRGPLMKSVEGGLILAAPLSLKARFREAAPDLWSVRSLVIELPPCPSDPPLLSPQSADPLLEVEALLTQGWVGEALPLADDALEDAQQGVARSPKDRRALKRLGDAWYQRARLLRGQGDIERSEVAAREALEIRQQLADRSRALRPNRLEELAQTLSLLGQLALDRMDLSAADLALQASMVIRQELANNTDDPETLAALALSHSLLGDLYLGQDLCRKALKSHDAALELRRHIRAVSPAHRHLRWLSIAWGRKARTQGCLGDRVRARAAWRRAWELARDLCAADPGNVNWQMEATVAGCRWGDAAFADQAYDQASIAWQEALAVREDLVLQDPENVRWQSLLAQALLRLGRLNRVQDHPIRATAYAERAAEIAQQVAADHPSNARWQRVAQEASDLLGQLRDKAVQSSL